MHPDVTRMRCTDGAYEYTRCNHFLRANARRVAARIDTIVTKANGRITSRLRETTSFSGVGHLQGRGYSKPDPADAHDPTGRSARENASLLEAAQRECARLASQENYRPIISLVPTGAPSSISFNKMSLYASCANVPLLIQVVKSLDTNGFEELDFVK